MSAFEGKWFELGAYSSTEFVLFCDDLKRSLIQCKFAEVVDSLSLMRRLCLDGLSIKDVHMKGVLGKMWTKADKGRGFQPMWTFTT